MRTNVESFPVVYTSNFDLFFRKRNTILWNICTLLALYLYPPIDALIDFLSFSSSTFKIMNSVLWVLRGMNVISFSYWKYWNSFISMILPVTASIKVITFVTYYDMFTINIIKSIKIRKLITFEQSKTGLHPPKRVHNLFGMSTKSSLQILGISTE